VTPGKQRDEDGPWLSIGALSKATGIAVETLRTWENRYGFPTPERKPSGHRVYPVSAVPRLRRIAQALALGHRAGQVVAASDDSLSRLLETSASALAASPPPASAIPAAEDVPTLLRLVKAFDGERLVRVFLSDWARMGPVEFLETRIAPLVRAVGEAWESGELEIRHEHFLSERIGDLLRSLRLPLDERATGPLVVYATLPGEMHGLGLQMSALVLSAVGCRCLYLGTEVPVPQIASLARDLNARAVAISLSLASRGPASAAALRKLRETLPRKVLLFAGGEGAPASRPGIDTAASLRELDGWGRRLASGLPVGAAAAEP
jgi:MerR family transcriptional regulator, light-induced transcriptional regulator